MKKTDEYSHFTPHGWHSVTPRIVVHEAQQLVEFVKHVFGKMGDYEPDRPAVLSLGDSRIMISDAGMRQPAPAFLYVYVENTDEAYRRAIEAGARTLEKPCGRTVTVAQWWQTSGAIFGKSLLISEARLDYN